MCGPRRLLQGKPEGRTALAEQCAMRVLKSTFEPLKPSHLIGWGKGIVLSGEL